MPEKFQKQDVIKKLPPKPGVYQFLNSNEEIIYIGKAKNLRKRVASYFKTSDSGNFKQETMVKKIDQIKYILVENESEALLLENNLIKENKPKYNILLKDDKTYPWICIKNERFPRVLQTRHYVTDGSEYFGPYTSGIMVKTLLGLIKQLYKLRSCKLSLSETGIKKGRFKRCLEFHLGNCKAPCEDLQEAEDYNQSVFQIREILKGNYHQVINHLKQLMQQFSSELRFEEAETIRQKIVILEKFKGKSTIVNPKISHVDVFSVIDEEESAYINFLKVVNGAIVQAHNIEIQKRLQEDKSEILGYVIYDIRKRFRSTAPEIILPFTPDVPMAGVVYTIPVRGDKRKLLDLSLRNATSFRNDKAELRQEDKWTQQELSLLTRLQSDLRLKKLPRHIECFDNSNIQGSDPVASCVVFKLSRPAKSDYRHYNIKTVKGSNDFASMEEIITRRYRRILAEKNEFPDLIIIDGGKGQLNSAVRSLKSLNLYDQVAIIGIAKRLEEIYTPEDPIPLYLDKNSSSLRLIQKIRDEAHRFGISFHRMKRSKAQLQSSLSAIPGIGEATRNRILEAQPDIERLKKMNWEELSEIAGRRAANILYNYFSNKR
ncbi:MAG: excinuclease ABC subunit UvrC [Bacteroidales bacterium]|nr:excinuclease ABC subunit UvrC [Bacteroidales bacterium]